MPVGLGYIGTTNNGVMHMPNLVPFEDAVRNLPAVSTESEGRIIFGVDATASRQMTWDRAKVEQAKMFAQTHGVKMQLVYFRGSDNFPDALGNGAECQHSGWATNPATLKRLMDKVECRAGETQIERLLRHVAKANKDHPVAALMYVGDMCEEVHATVLEAARAAKVRCFMFQEGTDYRTAELFRSIADVTGGAYASFGSGADMGALMTVVAQYATGTLNAPASGAPTYDVPKALPKE